jgi:hypothetical protein
MWRISTGREMSTSSPAALRSSSKSLKFTAIARYPAPM